MRVGCKIRRVAAGTAASTVGLRQSKCKIFQKRFDTRLRFSYKRGLAVRSLTTKPNAPAIL